MSEHDYSGVDERSGRWWGLSGGVLLLLGTVLVLALFVFVLNSLLSIIGD